MKAKKQFGQNFLNSRGALETIVDCSKIEKTDTILEIGPGKGALTEYLLKTEAKVIAVEKDSELIPLLTEKFVDYNNFTLVNADILDFDIEKCMSERAPQARAKTKNPLPYKVIGNIPYYITGQILRKFIDDGEAESMTLLVQKEVADRICKRGEEKDKESLISLAVQSYGIPKYIKTVPRGSFHPAPNVDSAIIFIKKHLTNPFGQIPQGRFFDAAETVLLVSQGENMSREDLFASKTLFFDLIHAGFAHKRKYCISNLKEKFIDIDFDMIFERLNLNKQIRSEDLKFSDWIALVSCAKECK